jgi:hypothetical protein
VILKCVCIVAYFPETLKLFPHCFDFPIDLLGLLFLIFEDKQLVIEYSVDRYHHEKKITLKEIFAYVSINLLNVTMTTNGIEDLIAESVGALNRFYLTDKTIAKKICNQFLALKLMYNKWVEGKGQYYGLTAKGVRLRDEMNLFKKEKKDGE